MSETSINVSLYRFAPLRELKPLRARLLAHCKAWGLKGTILLSREGINAFAAGPRPAIEALLEVLRSVPGLESIEPKESQSRHQPFTRMLVRIKKEIIAFGVEGIDPSKRTSPKLPPRELKKWLDEKRPITLLDTRNDFEIKLGSFEKALPIGIQKFRDFPQAVASLPEELKKRPVVMFCTGGIRCEKAGPYMESQGFEEVYQLEGGILKYFEECGDTHYRGDCFVFDHRVGLDPSLQETPNTQCFACLTPLTEAEQSDPRYVVGKSCSFCFKTSAQQMAATLQKRHAAIEALSRCLPGAEPCENLRPLKVSAKFDGQTLLDFLCGILSHIPRSEWQRACELGRFLDPDRHPAGAERIVRAGERYYHRQPVQSEPEVKADFRLLYEDEAILVLEKPAPLPVHPSGRYHRNTLSHLLELLYAPQKPRPAHRLDANTTGVMVVARTRHFAAALQREFARGGVEKSYLARVQGHPPDNEFSCEFPIGHEVLETGARDTAEEGLAARTEFKVRKRWEDGTSLLEVRPRTGRTNQIRVHLWRLGWPICGDPLYLPEGKLGNTQTLRPGDVPLCLHAQSLRFTHPLTGERVGFESGAFEQEGHWLKELSELREENGLRLREAVPE